MKERIRAVMDYAQMTQQDFASRLGISPASLSSIFTGRTNPSQKQVMAIHQAFPEINISWLMFGEGEMIVSSSSSEHQEAVSPQPQSMVSESPVTPQVQRSLFDAEPVAPAHTAAVQQPVVHSAQRESFGSYRQTPSAIQMVKNVDKPSRKIKEIRVFFDDGTYESFVPSSK